jgi:hypothetical protein
LMHLVSVDVHLSKNADANLAKPTGWPRAKETASLSEFDGPCGVGVGGIAFVGEGGN